MTKIRARRGDDEIEGSAEFIKEHGTGISTPQLKKPAKAAPRKKPAKAAPRKKPAGAPTPAEFYKSKGKTDAVSRILIFAKFLELYRDTSEFSRSDLINLAKELKLSKDIHNQDIHKQYFTNAVRQGLLRSLSGLKYTLTLSAEEVITSM